MHARQAERGGEQPRGLRRQFRPRRVGAAHDEGEAIECFGMEAELVEHHIKEEENDMLPEFRKESEPEERLSLGETYLSKWETLMNKGGEDAPSEKAKPEPVKPSLTHS